MIRQAKLKLLNLNNGNTEKGTRKQQITQEKMTPFMNKKQKYGAKIGTCSS